MRKNKAEERGLIEFEYDEIITKDIKHNSVLLLIEGSEEIWFPLNSCELDEVSQIINVPRFLAEKKGLM